MISALVLFFGIRSYRERAGGRLTFRRGLGVGILITLISSACYMTAFQVAYFDGEGNYRRPATGLADLPPSMLEESMSETPNHTSIVVTIGRQSRGYEAYVPSAPARFDAPSTLADVPMVAANDVALDPASARSGARLILVDATELTWQRARCRATRARAG